MKIADAIARISLAIIRILIALHPRDFRAAFGKTVVEENAGDIRAAVPDGAGATTAVAAKAIADAARGALVERALQIESTRRAMQNALTSDIRFALRALLRDRSFSAVAIGTLGVGLALCVTVAAFLNAYLVRGLPYPEADRLFNTRYDPEMMAPAEMEKLDWSSLGDVFELAISWDLDMFNLRGGAYPEVAQGTWVTPGYIEGFAVRPALGRGFEPTDFETGRPMVAMISHRLWHTRFNGDPNIIGRGIEAYVNDRPNEVETFTVVGVLPQRHWHLNAFTDMLAPLRAAPGYPYVVRLREGVPPAAAADRMTALARSANPKLPADWRVQLLSTQDSYVETIRPLLLAVATATALVLLIACANVGVLLTVRATRRGTEMAVRQALGATVGQITRACAAEPLLIGVTALVFGIAAAWSTIVSVSPLVDRYLGRTAPGGLGALRLDPATIAVAVAGGLLAIAVCSIVPMWIVRRSAASHALAGAPRGATDGPGQRRARGVLVAVEVAASLTLLVGAALAIESAFRMIRVDMGLNADHVVVGRFNLRQRVYPDAAARGTFYERVLARSGELNGVDGLAFTNSWPLQQAMTRDVGSGDTSAFATRAGIIGVSPDYFRTLGIRIHDGRVFTAGDRVGSEPVALVSHTLAARLWPRSSAIGQQLRIASANSQNPPTALRVIGVVGDTRHAHTDNDLADAYIPLLQSPPTAVFTYMRLTGDDATAEADLRRLLAALDPDVGLAAPRRLADILDLQRASLRLLGYLLVVFAAFAAALALVGIYGVIAYTVKQREREIAVLLAIGADRGLITRMFVGHGAIVLGSGLIAGIGGAVALGRIMQAQLFGVEPADPIVIAIMTMAFALCGLIAVAWPARSAATVDPAAALKE